MGSVARSNRLEHSAPTVGGVNIAGPQQAPPDIAELVEAEQRVVAGAAEVAVVRRAFLPVMAIERPAK